MGTSRSEVKGRAQPKACRDPTGQPQWRVLEGHSLGRLAAHFLWSHSLHCGKTSCGLLGVRVTQWRAGLWGWISRQGPGSHSWLWQDKVTFLHHFPGTCPVPAQSCQRPWRLSLREPGSSRGTVGTSHPHPSGSRAESAGWGGGPHGLGGAGRRQPEAVLFWAFSGAGGPDGA